jgi:hypothetical protein
LAAGFVVAWLRGWRRAYAVLFGVFVTLLVWERDDWAVLFVALLAVQHAAVVMLSHELIEEGAS